MTSEAEAFLFLPGLPLASLSEIAFAISLVMLVRLPTTVINRQGLAVPKHLRVALPLLSPKAFFAAALTDASPAARLASASAREDLPPPYGPVHVNALCWDSRI